MGGLLCGLCSIKWADDCELCSSKWVDDWVSYVALYGPTILNHVLERCGNYWEYFTKKFHHLSGKADDNPKKYRSG
jgi:hypothetical protein